jgi:transcriptional regulator GlxA family with amidase domain
MNTDNVTHLGFLIFPGFPMAGITSMIEPLRVANEITGKDVFTWQLISETGNRVQASAQVWFDPDTALPDVGDLDQLYILGNPSSRFETPRSSDGKLRFLARHGVTLGAISGGIFPLARAGLLGEATVSVHWCYTAAFQAEFPNHTATETVISHSKKRITVSGSAAAFDQALHLIDRALGPAVATEVACWFQHPMMRGQDVVQRKPTQSAASTADMLPQAVRKATEIFARHIADPLTVADVSETIGVSKRTLERLFKKSTGQSPLQYYRALRIKAARQMVLYSNDSLTEISLAVGYATASAMVQNYTDIFGIHPSEDRQKINMFRTREDTPLPMV